jgi:hypothetical protein
MADVRTNPVEAKHIDLFQWLLEKMDYPARPRKRLKIAS